MTTNRLSLPSLIASLKTVKYLRQTDTLDVGALTTKTTFQDGKIRGKPNVMRSLSWGWKKTESHFLATAALISFQPVQLRMLMTESPTLRTSSDKDVRYIGHVPHFQHVQITSRLDENISQHVQYSQPLQQHFHSAVTTCAVFNTLTASKLIKP